MTPALRALLRDEHLRDANDNIVGPLIGPFANLLLVDAGVRLSFSLEQHGFADRLFAARLASLVEANGYGVVPLVRRSGWLVCLPASTPRVRALAQAYDTHRDHAVLGEALSYPAAHDYPAEDASRYFAMEWSVKRPGEARLVQLMANVFRNPALLVAGANLAARMADVLEPEGLMVRFLATAPSTPSDADGRSRACVSAR